MKRHDTMWLLKGTMATARTQAKRTFKRHAHCTQAATGFKSNDPPAGPRHADLLG